MRQAQTPPLDQAAAADSPPEPAAGERGFFRARYLLPLFGLAYLLFGAAVVALIVVVARAL